MARRRGRSGRQKSGEKSKNSNISGSGRRSRPRSEAADQPHKSDRKSRDRGWREEGPRGRSGGGGRNQRPKRSPLISKDGKIQKVRATVDKARSGAAFLNLGKKGVDDIFVPPHEARHLFSGDRVEVMLSAKGDVLGLRILHRRFREIVGRYAPAANGREGLLIYQRKKSREEIFVPKAPPGARSGDWVRATLKIPSGPQQPTTAEIIEVIGPDLPAEQDIRIISGEYDLEEHHTPEAKAEAQAFRLEIPGKDEKGRTDLRNIPFITIDGETARDFDDAVYVEKKKDGGYILWVAIADVSHYVKDGTRIDAEAKERGTSVYFPERAFHMLPRELSENLCSLRPNEPRLAMAAEIHINANGNKGKTRLYDAIIQSRRRATYTEIQAEANKHRNDPKWEYHAHYELFSLLRKKRTQRGSLDFDLPEAEVLVDEKGEPIKIAIRERHDAHKLIEEFMIAANEAVTEWIMERGWPFIYRVHEEPAEQAILKFFSLCHAMGVDIGYQGQKKKGQQKHKGKRDSEEEEESLISPRKLAEIIKKFKGHDAEFLLNYSLLRSMKQAIYTSAHGIHFGLASRAYTHFTSPIRRYPDLIVHRLLRRALHAEKNPKLNLQGNERKDLENELEEQAEHCSYRERLASDAERESIRLKQVRMMLKHIGDEFDGTVIGMTEKGLFVQLNHPYAEGFVSRDTMDDFYVFNEDLMQFQGKRKKRVFKVGTPVRIRVERALLDQRIVDFVLVDTPRSR